MSDDLVKRLRAYEENDLVWMVDMKEAADRIEKLEAALRGIKDLSDRRSVHPMSSEADYFRIARQALEGKDD